MAISILLHNKWLQFNFNQLVLFCAWFWQHCPFLQVIIAGLLETDNCYGYTTSGSGATSILFEQVLTSDATGLSVSECAAQLQAQAVDTFGIMLQSKNGHSLYIEYFILKFSIKIKVCIQFLHVGKIKFVIPLYQMAVVKYPGGKLTLL